MRAISSAETTNVAASTAIAIGAVSHATSAPPSAGPEISAIGVDRLALAVGVEQLLAADEIGDEDVIGQRRTARVATPVIAATA